MKSKVQAKKKRPTKPREVRPKQPPKLRGLLPIPEAVAEFVEKEAKRLPMTAEFKKQWTDNLTLDYSFDGEVVLARFTPAGVEVLAVGYKEWDEFVKHRKPTEPSDYVVTHPGYWQ
jgi:hypothetical protein